MNVPETIKKDSHGKEMLAVAQLASAFTLLAEVPYDSWGHEGTPAEMAVLVYLDHKEKGRLGFLYSDILGINYRKGY